MRHHLFRFVALFALAGCSEDATLQGVENFGVVRAASTPTSYEAEATFLSPVEATSCESTPIVGGCRVTSCSEAPSQDNEVEAGPLTLQADETVLLDADNGYRVEADRSLFASGDDVLVDLADGEGVPGFTRTLTAPSGTALSSPLPDEGEESLELRRGYSVRVEWAKGSDGYLRAAFGSPLVTLACEWALADTSALIDSSLIDRLPSSDGSDSHVEFWTEASDVVDVDDWQFLLLLQGDVSGVDYDTYTLD